MLGGVRQVPNKCPHKTSRLPGASVASSKGIGTSKNPTPTPDIQPFKTYWRLGCSFWWCLGLVGAPERRSLRLSAKAAPPWRSPSVLIRPAVVPPADSDTTHRPGAAAASPSAHGHEPRVPCAAGGRDWTNNKQQTFNFNVVTRRKTPCSGDAPVGRAG